MSQKIHTVDGPEHLAGIRELFVEYARALDFHICFEGFEKELAQLPGVYALPRGDYSWPSSAPARPGVWPSRNQRLTSVN